MNTKVPVRQVFAVVIVSILISGAISAATLAVAVSRPSNALVPLGLLAGELCLIIPAWLYARRLGSAAGMFRLRPVSGQVLAVATIFGAGLTIVMDEVDRIIGRFFPAPEELGNLAHQWAGTDLQTALLLFLGIVVGAAVGEELLFRGFLQQTLERRWGDPTRAVLTTSLAFAALHFNPWWAIQIYTIGLFLGFLAWRTGSVFPGMAVHAVNNAAAFAFGRWSAEMQPWYLWRGHVAPWMLLAGGAAAVAAFLWLNKMPLPIRTGHAISHPKERAL